MKTRSQTRSNVAARASAGGSRPGGARRRVALLGGSTSLVDCLTALGYLLTPHRLIDGPALRRYEAAFAEYVGVRHGYSFSGGRVALYGILKVLGIGAGDEVLVQVPTHIVVANAIRYTGARPVYADSDPGTCNLDLEVTRRRITERTKALILQHTFGIPAELDAALDLARTYDIDLIEDCVHSLGSAYKGRRVGSFGRAAFFSTEETKTISTTMGGMAVTNDDQLARGLQRFQASCGDPSISLTTRYLIKLIVYHVLTEPHLHRYLRTLYEWSGRRNPLPGPTTEEEIRGMRPKQYERRLSNAQAATGLRQLRRLEGNLAHRRWVASEFDARLRDSGVETPKPPPHAAPAYVRYPVYVRDRETAVRTAAPHAVLGTWFTSVLEEAIDPSDGGYEAGSCPCAEQLLSKRLVNLPTHERVRRIDIEAIVSAILRSG